MPEINYLAVFAAALSSFLLGGVWYAVLFKKAHSELAGITHEQAQKNLPTVFGGAFALGLLGALAFAFFIGPVGVAEATMYGFTAGLCWVAGSFGINYLFERRPLKLFLINGGYHTLQYTLIGLILGAWK